MSRFIFLLMMTISKSLSLFAIFFYAKYISINELSVWSDIMSIYFLMFPIISLQIQSGIFRFSIEDKNKLLPLVNLSCFLYVLSFALLFFNSELENRFVYSLILCLNSIAVQFHLEYIRGVVKEIVYYVLTFLQVFVSFLIGIVFLLLDQSYKSIIYGDFVGLSLILVGAIYVLNKNKINIFLFRIKLLQLRSVLKYSLPLVPNAIAWWIITSGAISISNVLVGGNSAATVNINLKASLIVSSLGFILATVMQRKLIESYEESFSIYKKEFTKKLTKYILLLSGVCLISNLVFYELLIRFYSEYFMGYNVILFSSISGLLYSLSSVIGVMYICHKETILALKSILISSVTSVILMWYFSKEFGVSGIFFSLMIGFSINLTIRLLDFNKLVMKNVE